MQAWIHPPFRACKITLRSEKSLRFFRLRLQGVTHYTLPCKEPCARRSSGLPYGRSYALLSYALRLRIKERRHDGYSSCEGVSQNTVTIVMTVMQGIRVTVTAIGRGIPKLPSPPSPLSPKGQLPAEERKMMDYALCNPAFPETQSGRRCGLRTPQRAEERSLQKQPRYRHGTL